MGEGSQQASSFEYLLEECRNLFCERLRGAIAGMLEKGDESLVEMTTRVQNREAQQTYQETRKVLSAQRRTLETKFYESYLKEFQAHTSKLKDEGQSFSEIDVSLELVGDDDLAEDLKYKKCAAKLRQFCAEELSALDQRVGVLLGDANLVAEDNPFGPESIGVAYQKACRALDSNAKVRDVLLQLFDDHVVDEVRSIYKDVNALLVKNSILPKIRYGVSKKAAGKPGAKEESEEEEESAEAKTGGAGPSEENFFAMLQSLVAKAGGAGGPGVGGGGGPGVGGGPGGGGGIALPPGAVILQGAELIGSLTRLQQGAVALPEGVSAAAAAGEANVLRELKTSNFGAGLQQMDAATLDIVSMMFDELFDDPKIPVGLKGLIGRLQIPMLKVAIGDKSFFGKKTHPARQLLDTFGEVAVRLATDFNPDSTTYVHLEAIVHHLVSTFQDDVGVFERAREQLVQVIAEHDKQVESATSAESARIEQTENLSAAKTAAQDEVRVRVRAHNLPKPVFDFLVKEWVKHLLVVHAKSGGASAEWKNALEAMDELIWSVEPITTTEERRKLAALVPSLVRRLVAGMQGVRTETPAREHFLGELMKHHTVALDAKKAKDLAVPAPEPPVDAQVANAALDFTAPVTVQNPYGEGTVEVVDLDFTPPPPAQPVDEGKRLQAKEALMSSLAVEPPANMAKGSWVEFRPKEEGAEPRTAKVLFVSPKKTRYLFSDRRGKDILELTRAEIVRRLRSGEAVRLEEEPAEPLFDRFMNGVMGKLRSPQKAAA
ncbi:MAG TPA: DUF1631 family protein [Burkholderiales bacterium]|nr:DUF1631 family protein [Burkholderiales bacterium]